MCQLGGLRDAQRGRKTFLLGVSARAFLEEISIGSTHGVKKMVLLGAGRRRGVC